MSFSALITDAKFVNDFWSRVDSSAGSRGCWPWVRGKGRKGYGLFHKPRKTDRPRSISAHRLAWMIANKAAVPDGLIIRHRCDNPPCCNPDHLLPGTRLDNAHDAMERGQVLSHDRHPSAVLNVASVTDVIRRMKAGESRSSIARSLGVCAATIDCIAWGKTWKRVQR